MLNYKICLVDFTGSDYDINSIYNDKLSRSQLELLYLATALSVRPNQITVMHERDSSKSMHGVRFEPLPDDPSSYWSNEDFDIVLCLDTLDGADKIRPHLPSKTSLVLWTHRAPEHVSMLPLKHQEVQDAWSAIIFESASLRQSFVEHFNLTTGNFYFMYPAIVRTLRQRFTSSNELRAVRNPGLTLAYTALPEHGLQHIFAAFQVLQEAFSELKLQVFLPPDYEEEFSDKQVQELLQNCRATEQVTVLEPQPWPNYVEELLKCHVLCNPLGFYDPGAAHMIDALAAGCQVLSIEHPSLQEIARDLPIWIPQEPTDDYLARYSKELSRYLQFLLEDPDYTLKRAFAQVAAVSTCYTWDLRVWEWESLLFNLLNPEEPTSTEPASSETTANAA